MLFSLVVTSIFLISVFLLRTEWHSLVISLLSVLIGIWNLKSAPTLMLSSCDLGQVTWHQSLRMLICKIVIRILFLPPLQGWCEPQMRFEHESIIGMSKHFLYSLIPSFFSCLHFWKVYQDSNHPSLNIFWPACSMLGWALKMYRWGRTWPHPQGRKKCPGLRCDVVYVQLWGGGSRGVETGLLGWRSGQWESQRRPPSENTNYVGLGQEGISGNGLQSVMT